MKAIQTLTLASTILTLGACAPCDPDGGVICTAVGLGTAGFSGDGADALSAELYQPMDMTVGPDGRLFVVDWNNHRIRVVGHDNVIETIAGNGRLGDGPTGPALQAAFNHPTNLAFDARGRMYIAAWHNSRIRRLDLSTGMLDHVCGTGGRSYSGDGGPAETAVLDLPAGIAFDADGNLIVVDQANQVLRQIDLEGNITRIAGQCVVDTCEEGQTPTQCPDSDKYSCTMETDDTACMRPCQRGFAGDGGPALEARFAMPFGQEADPAGRVAIDTEGNIFMADTHNHRIRRIDTDGIVTTVAGTGERGFSGDGGPASAAQLNNPVDLAFGDDGTLYVADTFNSCVRAIDPAGAIRTVAGVCGTRGYGGDGGPAERALLDWPYGIHVAGDRLYIADTINHRIRVVGL
jgi:sugar lactone lactonase YvrE